MGGEGREEGRGGRMGEIGRMGGREDKYHNTNCYH